MRESEDFLLFWTMCVFKNFIKIFKIGEVRTCDLAHIVINILFASLSFFLQAIYSIFNIS